MYYFLFFSTLKNQICDMITLNKYWVVKCQIYHFSLTQLEGLREAKR